MPVSKDRLIAMGVPWPQAQNLGYVVYAGTPSGNLTPEFIGQVCYDSTNKVWYTATATDANTDWASAADVPSRIVSIADGTNTLALTQAAHANKIVYTLDASLAITLPEATGTGDKYTVVLGIQATAVTIVTADTSNAEMRGMLNAYDTDSEATLPSYPAVSGDDTITLNGAATGGKIYDRFEFIDILTDVWLVSGQIALSGGSEVTPFSSAA